MKTLREAVKRDGQNLGNGILKVDSFVNHRIDCALMREAGKELSNAFRSVLDGVDFILTSETSGLIPAIMVGLETGLPVVFARKKKSVTMGPTYDAVAPSHTKKSIVTLSISKEFIKPESGVLIIDDFLASGNTILAMNSIITEAGANLIGVGTLIEKSFEGGREKLSGLRIPVVSLVTIVSMNDGDIVFTE